MAVQLESAARLAALRDKADAVTGESSATLAGAVDALIAGFGAGGGSTGGSLESGELTTTSANYYGFTIPVTSKKSYFVICPKNMANHITNPNKGGRTIFVFGIDGDTSIKAYWQKVPSDVYSDGTARAHVEQTTQDIVFSDESIQVSGFYAPFEITEYYWFAW